MTPFLKLASLFCLTIFSVVCVADNFLGPGKWSITGAMSCDDEDRYPYRFDLFRKRINRTHEGISGHFVFPDGLDDSIGVRIVVCKYVDGGCKPYRVITDKSFQSFCNRFAPENIQEIFKLAGIDPPGFPVKAGEYNMEECLLNYDELPESAAYGAFRAELYLTKNFLDLSCLVILAEFNELSE